MNDEQLKIANAKKIEIREKIQNTKVQSLEDYLEGFYHALEWCQNNL